MTHPASSPSGPLQRWWKRVFHASPGAGRGSGQHGPTAGGDVTSTASIDLRPRDCHTHVIPGVDDGSRSLDESLAMLRLLQAAGASRVIATPHIFPGRFPNEPEHLRPRFDALLCAATAAGIAVELELGAEHYLDEHLLARVIAGRVLAFGPERYVLFEAHTGPTPPIELWPVVRALLDRGYTPLLAHVERYRWLRSGDEGEELIEDLRCAGVKFQVNRTVGQANRPGEGSRGRFLARALARGWIDEVGSDLHRPTAEGRPYADDERGAPIDAGTAADRPHDHARKPTRAVA